MGLAIGYAWSRQPRPWDFWACSALAAILPDADVVGFLFGVNYLDTFGHRGFTHSLLFAACFGPFVTAVLYRHAARFSRAFWVLSAHFAVVTASHGVLDAMTDGGEGVAFFSPFELGRYFFPWRPLVVSPIGMKFFSRWGVAVLESELVYAIVPAIVFAGLAHLVVRWATGTRTPPI